MGVRDFLKLVRFVCSDAIVPQRDAASGGLSPDYSMLKPTLERLDAVIYEGMHRMHTTAHGMTMGASLGLFFDKFLADTVGEACECDRVSTVVLLFDSGHHRMKDGEIKKRAEGVRSSTIESFEDKWFKNRENRKQLMDEFRTWMENSVPLRDGLNLVVHGLWPEPRVFWREGDTRRISTPVERGLAPPDIKWPTTCHEADDLVMLWVKLLLYPCDKGPAHNLMVVSNDSDILMDMLTHAALMAALPEEKQPRARDGPDADIVCLYRGDRVAGGVMGASGRVVPVYANEYINVFAAADTLSATFAPATLCWAPGMKHMNTVLVALTALWLCHRHDYSISTWVSFCADVTVWFPLAIRAMVEGDVGATLEMRYSGEPGPWTPIEARVNAIGLRDTFSAIENHFHKWKRDTEVADTVSRLEGELELLEQNQMLTSITNVKKRIEEARRKPVKESKVPPMPVFHAQSARLALWLSKRLNNHLPGWRGLPDELEKDGDQSRWGYELHEEEVLQNETALAAGFQPRSGSPPMCVPAKKVAHRAVYFVPN